MSASNQHVLWISPRTSPALVCYHPQFCHVKSKSSSWVKNTIVFAEFQFKPKIYRPNFCWLSSASVVWIPHCSSLAWFNALSAELNPKWKIRGKDPIPTAKNLDYIVYNTYASWIHQVPMYIYIYICTSLSITMFPANARSVPGLSSLFLHELSTYRLNPHFSCSWKPQVLAVKSTFLLVFYPLVNVYIAMENQHFSWGNSLFLWPFSIAMSANNSGFSH